MRRQLLEVEPSPAPPGSVVSIDTVRSELLDAETTLISFFVLIDQVVAWVIDREGGVFVRTGLGAGDLEGVRCFARQTGAPGSTRGARPRDGCDDAAALATELYARLFSPLLPHLRHRKLVLVAHDALHTLPFAALRHPETGRFLIEDFTVSLAPSASALRLMGSEPGPTGGGALVLGDPRPLPAGLQLLQGAQAEAAAVARLLGVEPALGERASESLVRAADGRIGLLHLAAHGVYRADDPRRSFIALAPDAEHDGRLEMGEIVSGLDLSGAGLVVLSACETALGERSDGDEVVGLVRALLQTGAPAVIATLWKVDDEASAELMVDLYRRLLDGSTAAEALRQAQLEMLRRPGFESPYYWAGYTLTGDPRASWSELTRPPAAAEGD